MTTIDNVRIDGLAEMRLEDFVRPLLVRTHKTRTARYIGGKTRYIGGKNSGQPAFDEVYDQSGAPQPHRTRRNTGSRAYLNPKREGAHSLQLRRSI
jgi:hypothetical protein